MADYEQLFSNCTLDVIVPSVQVEFPKGPSSSPGPEWWSALKDEARARDQTFFDELLEFWLALRIDSTNAEDVPADPAKPPIHILAFLAHVQVALEAMYIAPAPTQSSSTLRTPPRTAASMGRLKPPPQKRGAAAQAGISIFPPTTPHPTPAANEADKRYARSEGTMLLASVWGESPSKEAQETETFALAWNATDKVWVAFYKLSLSVAFLRMNVANPLLCLTVSATLRDKAIAVTPARQPLQDLIDAVGGLPAVTSTSDDSSRGLDGDKHTNDLKGLDEVNLLEGLAAAPTFSDDKSLVLPSTRLGPSTRRQLSLVPLSDSPSQNASPASNMTTARTALTGTSTMRKSYRKTLPAVSGFTVRMRTVFVPYVLLPSSNVSDELEAGSEENTVVLCVEIDNTGDSGVGFAVESVDVNIGGEGATARLIGWGETGFRDPDKVFPIRAGPLEQYNLLYAVTFLRPPDADEVRLGRPDARADPLKAGDLQRAVSIVVNGRPYAKPEDAATKTEYEYPTHPFSSRWNCILDLSPRRNRTSLRDSRDLESFGLSSARDALPEPASPFPEIMSPHTAKASTFAQAQTQASPAAVAGSKRHTLAAITTNMDPGLRKTVPANYRLSTSMLNPAFQRDRDSLGTYFPAGKAGSATALPPSINIPSAGRRTPTTYDGPSPGPVPRSPPLPALPPGATRPSIDSSFAQDVYAAIPPTPAYPAYDPQSPLPPMAHSQGPVQGQHADAVGVGPSVEARRQRGVAMRDGVGAVTPGTPGPTAGLSTGTPTGFNQLGFGLRAAGSVGPDEGEPIVVSVSLLPQERSRGSSTDDEVDEDEADQRIYPLDKFTLDVFVFNQSSWTRRFELSVPDKRRRRQERIEGTYFSDVPEVSGGGVDSAFASSEAPGIVALENRIRIGPLRPSTCQSIRMDFMALTPGVHCVDALTLTDVETGYTVNMRSVLDVVVHEAGAS
ncbi:hypothetical protein PUNSTDRAFT_141620 [Punctularia strigosozonata HHB-11173 SS5]|uniref:uncharacterized protein n=1 Tax=Punctularia strigosozonata (strain HHB-11173) TaxID=741275 RepID=UPI00044183D6|nr:uncharacterized protein PUNSTDRAFT_141620 [Punctularia strigosozonata HHB-11173 SS5]EIN11169.1 hypothetical protein PUNSTDRAFT_141620 [Punctularia strigosozonata HHB-11173 SS5]